MIVLKSSRQYVSAVKAKFFPYINLYKNTRLINLEHKGATSEEYLSGVVVNCLLSEIEVLFDKKLINTTGPQIKFQLTDAQAVVLYRTLLALPVHRDNIYMQLIRNEWLQVLDQELLQKGLCAPIRNQPVRTVDQFEDFGE